MVHDPIDGEGRCHLCGHIECRCQSVVSQARGRLGHEMSEAEVFSAGWHNGYHCGTNGLGGQLASDLMIFMGAKQR